MIVLQGPPIETLSDSQLAPKTAANPDLASTVVLITATNPAEAIQSGATEANELDTATLNLTGAATEVASKSIEANTATVLACVDVYSASKVSSLSDDDDDEKNERALEIEMRNEDFLCQRPGTSSKNNYKTINPGEDQASNRAKTMDKLRQEYTKAGVKDRLTDEFVHSGNVGSKRQNSPDNCSISKRHKQDINSSALSNIINNGDITITSSRKSARNKKSKERRLKAKQFKTQVENNESASVLSATMDTSMQSILFSSSMPKTIEVCSTPKHHNQPAQFFTPINHSFSQGHSSSLNPGQLNSKRLSLQSYSQCH